MPTCIAHFTAQNKAKIQTTHMSKSEYRCGLPFKICTGVVDNYRFIDLADNSNWYLMTLIVLQRSRKIR